MAILSSIYIISFWVKFFTRRGVLLALFRQIFYSTADVIFKNNPKSVKSKTSDGGLVVVVFYCGLKSQT